MAKYTVKTEKSKLVIDMAKYSVEVYNGNLSFEETYPADTLEDAVKIATIYVSKSVIGFKQSDYPKIFVARIIQKVGSTDKLVTYMFKDCMTGKVTKTHMGGGYVIQCNDSFPFAKASTITQARQVAYRMITNYVNMVDIEKPVANGYDTIANMLMYRGHNEYHEKGKEIKSYNPATGKLSSRYLY